MCGSLRREISKLRYEVKVILMSAFGHKRTLAQCLTLSKFRTLNYIDVDEEFRRCCIDKLNSNWCLGTLSISDKLHNISGLAIQVIANFNKR